MIYVLIGVLAWVFLILFEAEKVSAANSGKKRYNPFFTLGTVLLLLSWGWFCAITFSRGTVLGVPPVLRIAVGCVLLAAGIAFYTAVLFFAFPKGTLSSDGEFSTVRTGLYAKCRHPGIYAFFIVAIGAAVTSGSLPAALVSLGHALANLLYVILQDRIFFPRYLKGYREYQKTVPFFGKFR